MGSVLVIGNLAFLVFGVDGGSATGATPKQANRTEGQPASSGSGRLGERRQVRLFCIGHRLLRRNVIYQLAISNLYQIECSYNLGWGAFSALDPQWIFRFAEMPRQNYPEIFACLGMVIGLYGILYLEVARIPEQGWLLAAVGLVGKILGPIGWLILARRGQWPMTTAVLCVTNDLIWWVPFSLYLYDAWPPRRSRSGTV